MMNSIGKGLVLIYTMFSIMGLMLAIVIYFEFIDWGRAEPRVLRGEPTKGSSGSNDMRIASEYEKSKVMFDYALSGRNLVVPPMAPAEQGLHEAEQRFAQNHLYYVAELKKLREDPGIIEVKALPAEGIPTDTPGKAIGKPIPSVKIAELDRSLKTYNEILKMEQDKIKPIEDAIYNPTDGGITKKNSDLSFVLTGKDDTGKKKQHGLFDLIDLEFNTRQRLLEEFAYVQPEWASVVEEARRFSARRVSLEATLSGLEKALKEKQAKQK
jgi:hypothetical protein